MDRRRPPRVAALLALVVLAAAPIAVAADAGSSDAAPERAPTRILTSPPRILASIAPGASSTSSILVVNQSRATTSVLLRVADLAPDPEGDSFADVVDVGDAPRGAGAWLSIQQPTLTLGPGEQKSVPITIRVPDDADAGGHYGAVVVETAPNESADEPVRVRVRLVTHVNVLVPGNVRYDASIGDLRVVRRARGVLDVRARFENEGNIQTTPRDAVVVVRGPGGARRVKLTIPETIPDGTRQLHERVRIPSAAGRFRTRVQLELEDGSIVRSRSIETIAWRAWVPPALLGLLAIPILLLVVVPFVRRRREFRRLLREELARDPYDEAPDEGSDGPDGPAANP